MRKNVASQVITAQMNSRTDGTAVTTGVSVSVLGDGGTLTVGAGTLAHEGGGLWSYIPTQAETNFNHVVFQFSASTAVDVAINIYPTSLDPTNTTNAGISKFGDLETDTQDIQSRLPAALVSGRIDASIGAVQAGAITAAGFAASAIDATALATSAVEELADQVWEEAQADHVAAASFGEIATEIAQALTDLTTLLSRLSAARAGYLDTLRAQQESLIEGNAQTGTLTTTSATTDLTGYAADELIGRVITFDKGASGCPGFQSIISDYIVASGEVFWQDTASAAPVNGDGFTIS